jgi:hypothetical protein
MELQVIQNRIFEVRGYRIILDFHLAELYNVETRSLKQAVKRNKERFPSDFMITLTKEEWTELITNCDKLPENIRHNPIPPSGFTEQGVAMLSSVLRSKTAICYPYTCSQSTNSFHYSFLVLLFFFIKY